MIEINLLPEEIKARPKGRKTGLNIESKYFIYLLPLALGLVVLLHVYLAALTLWKNVQLRSLSRKWQAVASQRKVLEDFNKEYSMLSSEAQAMKQLIQRRLAWAQKLNKLSSLLPSGIWFREISVTPRDFTIHGSAVSLQMNEMGLIREFMDNLNGDAGFSKEVNTLELTSVQKKSVGGYAVADFVLNGTLK